MSMPAKVKFHITEAGPKKCVAVSACPKSPEEPHYENYAEAVKVYESQLASNNHTFAPKLSKLPPGMTFEALKKPQWADIRAAKEQVKSHFYLGASSAQDYLDSVHRELWFDHVVEHVTPVPPETIARLSTLRPYLASPDILVRRKVKLEVEELVSPYRTPENKEVYYNFLEPQLEGKLAVDQAIWSLATPLAESLVYARALENRLPIPKEISRAFEKNWNADAFTAGSRLNVEKELVELVRQREALIKAEKKDEYANKLGYSTAKEAIFSVNMKARAIRAKYYYRGRNDPKVIAKINKKFGMIAS